MPNVVRVPSLRLTELDGSPDIQGVERIYLTNGFLSSLGGGAALLSLSGSGAASSLAVQDIDGVPNVSNVSRIYLTNGFLSDLGGGSVLISLSGGTSGAPADADYWVETANGSLSQEIVVGTTGITTAAYASRQAAAKSGRLFLPNNGYYIERDSGSAWASWGPIFPLTPPDNTTFSDVNIDGSTTVSTTNGGISITRASNGSAQSVRLRARALAVSSNYTLQFAFIPLLYYQQFSQAMVGLRDTGTDDAVFFVVTNDSSNLNFGLVTWTSNTSGGTGTYIALTAVHVMPWPLVWVKFVDDGTNRITYWSNDGVNWIQLHTTTRTNFLTPNQLCFGINPFSQATGINLLSLKETAP
jgi:hypothetical protein